MEWDIWFVGTVREGSLINSLGGEEQIGDEKLWLAVKELYPERFKEFLSVRIVSMAQTEEILLSMGLFLDEIKKWVVKEGEDVLREHYMRSMRLNINSSPTLLVNNKLLGRELTAKGLAVLECGRRGSPVGSKCDSVPGCFDDQDCMKEGKIGRCVEDQLRGRVCEFREGGDFRAFN